MYNHMPASSRPASSYGAAGDIKHQYRYILYIRNCVATVAFCKSGQWHAHYNHRTRVNDHSPSQSQSTQQNLAQIVKLNVVTASRHILRQNTANGVMQHNRHIRS
jgi:hypothetical protein